jgi:hypothetical protein
MRSVFRFPHGKRRVHAKSQRSKAAGKAFAQFLKY